MAKTVPPLSKAKLVAGQMAGLTKQMAKQMTRQMANGRFIFIYNHVRTGQVVYNQKPVLSPQILKKQMTPIGDNFENQIRKDMWQPFATVVFPSNDQSLDALQKLMEFRKRHEFDWKSSNVGKKIERMGKDFRARYLANQKTNTVADLAAVLQLQEEVAEGHSQLNETETKDIQEELTAAEQRSAEVKKLKLEALGPYKALRSKVEDNSSVAGEEVEQLNTARELYKKYKTQMMKLKKEIPKLQSALEEAQTAESSGTVPAPKVLDKGRRITKFSLDGVKIEWADISNAEYAQSWPTSIVHDAMSLNDSTSPHVTPRFGAGGDASSSFDTQTTPQTTIDVPVEQPKSSVMQRVVDRLRFGRQAPAVS